MKFDIREYVVYCMQNNDCYEILCRLQIIACLEYTRYVPSGGVGRLGGFRVHILRRLHDQVTVSWHQHFQVDTDPPFNILVGPEVLVVDRIYS